MLTTAGIVDVTSGNNSQTFPDAHNNKALTTVIGFSAGPGYDLASGWGTINAAKFIPALAGSEGGDNGGGNNGGVN